MSDDPTTTPTTPTPADPAAIRLLPAAAPTVGEVIADAAAADFGKPSPCEGWTARDVLNHLVSEHLWAPHLLRGETLEQVGDQYDGDVLTIFGAEDTPDGWRETWRTVIAGSLAAWADADRSASVHTSMGEIPVAEYAHQMLVDLTVHAWDLAAALGVPVELDGEAVRTAHAYEREQQSPEGTPGIFAAPVDVPADADAVTRLVALLGRDPQRWPVAG